MINLDHSYLAAIDHAVVFSSVSFHRLLKSLIICGLPRRLMFHMHGYATDLAGYVTGRRLTDQLCNRQTRDGCDKQNRLGLI